jgi:hypothetical protein
VKPTNGSFIFNLFSKGDQLEVTLANLKFSKIRDGPSIFSCGGGLVKGGRDFRVAIPGLISASEAIQVLNSP